MSAADEEKRATIVELKGRFDENNNKLKQLESQRRQNEINLRRSAFTAAYLSELPDNVATYRSVGKAYFLEPKNGLMSHLEEVVTSADTELKNASTTRESLISTQEGLARELNELMASLKKS